METFRSIPSLACRTGPLLAFALHGWSTRRDPPTVADASDATLVIDGIYLGHVNRQAMLSAQAQLRGDDSAEQVW